MAFGLLFFAILTNLIVMQYALGVVTAGLDEGVRQGARSVDASSACLSRIDATVTGISGGAITSVSRSCGVQGEWIVARLDGRLVAWAPLIPSMSFTREARAPIEDLTG